MDADDAVPTCVVPALVGGRGPDPRGGIPDDGTLVIRADLPGIDPEKDVEVTVAGGTLHIEAERREEQRREEKGYVRREVRYGSAGPVAAAPGGRDRADITATYKDGVLEIRIPEPTRESAKKIAIGTS